MMKKSQKLLKFAMSFLQDLCTFDRKLNLVICMNLMKNFRRMVDILDMHCICIPSHEKGRRNTFVVVCNGTPFFYLTQTLSIETYPTPFLYFRCVEFFNFSSKLMKSKKINLHRSLEKTEFAFIMKIVGK